MITSDRSNKEPKDGTNARSVTERCQSVFLDVIVSDKFSSLCNLLCRNFQGIKANGCFDFSRINSRMEKGQYEDSSELFALDIQKVISCKILTFIFPFQLLFVYTVASRSILFSNIDI